MVKTFLALLLLLLPLSSYAATKYVAVTGSNTNPGSQNCPWRTIQHGLNTVQPGDTLVIGPGVYRERVTTNRQFDPPVTVSGTRGPAPANEYLTTVDGGEQVSTPWVAAPEYGAGVWKTTPAYQPWSLTVDLPTCSTSNPTACSKTIWRISTDAMNESSGFAPGGEYAWLSGPYMLTRPATEHLTPPYSNTQVPHWDGIEAIWGYKNSTMYVRFKDGDNPNSKSMYISPGPSSTYAQDGVGVFTLNGARGVQLIGLRIRGGRNGVLMTAGANHNQVSYSDISNGQARVRIDTGSHTNTIFANNLYTNHISGRVNGARIGDGVNFPVSRVKNWHLYFVDKFTVGQYSEDDHGVFLWGHGQNNYIYQNTIHEGAIGIDVAEGPPIVGGQQTTIEGNSIRYQIAQGLFLQRGSNTVHVRHNHLADNGIGIRIQELELGSHDLFVYFNTSWQPFGEHIWLHGTPQTGATSDSSLALYQNSFGGPLNRQVFDLALSDRITNMPNAKIINNIFGSEGLPTNWSAFGFARNNLHFPGYSFPNNFQWTTKPWGESLTVPDFRQVPSQAINSGYNLYELGFPGITAPTQGALDLGAYPDCAPSCQ